MCVCVLLLYFCGFVSFYTFASVEVGGRCIHVHFDVLCFAACYCVHRRKVRYQGTPRNIYRHFIISDIKDATATLPPVSLGTQHLRCVDFQDVFIGLIEELLVWVFYLGGGTVLRTQPPSSEWE